MIEHLASDLDETFHRLEIPEGCHHAVHVEPDVLVHDHVAEARQQLKPQDQLGRESLVPRQIPHRVGVVLEAPRRADRSPARSITSWQTVRSENSTSLCSLDRLPARHQRPQRAKVIEVTSELGQALDQEGHRARASSLIRRARRKNGSRSAARSWTSRTKA